MKVGWEEKDKEITSGWLWGQEKKGGHKVDLDGGMEDSMKQESEWGVQETGRGESFSKEKQWAVTNAAESKEERERA